MTDSLTLNRLQKILNDAGFDDAEISRGIELTKVGYQKVASKLGVTFREANDLILQLVESLRSEEQAVQEDYQKLLDDSNSDRFSFEKDFLGNVTIRDSHTGDEVFLRGQKSATLLNELQAGADEQETLAQYMAEPINEDDVADAEQSYEPEIDMGGGSYNFPWKVGPDHGTATAIYSGTGTIKIVSVRDEDGEEGDMSVEMNKALMPQAVAFIGKA